MILKRIILPQAMRFVVPPTGNEAINLLKMTSLVTFIAVDDLLLLGAEHLCAHLRDHSAADRGGFLVSRRGQHHVGRPAFPRALFRTQRASQRMDPVMRVIREALGLRAGAPMSIAKAENRARFGVPADSMVFARGVRKSYGAARGSEGRRSRRARRVGRLHHRPVRLGQEHVPALHQPSREAERRHSARRRRVRRLRFARQQAL